MIMVEPAIVLGIRLALVLLVGMAVAHKLGDLPRFAATVRSYVRDTTLGGATGMLVGLVIAMELAIILLAATAVAPLLAGVAAAALFLLYGAAIAINLVWGNKLLDCGCSWGNARQPATWHLVMRNLVLAVIALTVALPVADRPLTTVDIVSAAGTGAMLLLLYVLSNQLIANAQQMESRA